MFELGYKVWKIAPHFDRIAEFREMWPRDDYRVEDHMLVYADEMLAGRMRVPDRLVEDIYRMESPLSRKVWQWTMEWMTVNNLRGGNPPPELWTAWLVDGCLRWHPMKAMPRRMQPKLTYAEIPDIAAECERREEWVRQLFPHALYPPSETAVKREAVTARKIYRFLLDNRMADEAKRLLDMVE